MTNENNFSNQDRSAYNPASFNPLGFRAGSNNNKQRTCPLNGVKITYKDVEQLKKCLSANGRILPRRITGVCAKNQRKLNRQVKYARLLALLPFSNLQS